MSTIPDDLIELFSNMDFVSSIKPGHKLCFRTKKYIPASSYYGSFHRYMYDQSALDCATRIRKMCVLSVSLLFTYEGTEYCNILLEKLIEVRKGINELIKTYDDDKHLDEISSLKTTKLLIEINLPEDIKRSNNITTKSAVSPKLNRIPQPPNIDDFN